jgi:hypothetical protein
MSSLPDSMFYAALNRVAGAVGKAGTAEAL